MQLEIVKRRKSHNFAIKKPFQHTFAVFALIFKSIE